VYALGGKYVSFSATVGIDDGTKGKGSSEFLVYADDSLLFKSGVIKGQMAPAVIAVSVAGKNKLKLVTTIGPDTYDMDDADWADALLVEKPTVSVLPVRPGALPRRSGNTAGSDLFDMRGARLRAGAGATPSVLIPSSAF
jgi:hypothetical protein